ncbi:9523_t:CDS:10 [Funneliformis caledonium]|uniref:9523_t:CDS:1 n=1 Tax=Funneliformis caledonium TaxID=1117310 RepID=A0A9N9CJH4_9GLOM|nr:9523_t:CDS:10 [Funneliformis caledonium]
MKTSDGKSRYFGFIGYRTEQEANEALKYFNNTYIHTSRIAVEIAKPVNDSSLSRPWSAHSVGSSRYEMKHQQFRQQNPNNKSLDDTSKNAKIEKSDDDELYQDLPKQGKKNVTKSANNKNNMSSSESEDEEMQDVDTTIDSISDTDWLKSRMRGKLDLEDEGENKVDSSSDPDNESSQDDEEKDDIDVQSYDTNNDDIQTPNKEANNNNHSTEVPAEESIGETGRLFVRNLPYICTEEDLRREFIKFGPLAEVHMPLDKETKKQKGFAYILYHIPEHAVMAYIELDNKFFMGRLLHILPSRERPTSRDVDQSKWSLKKQKEMKLKAQATNDFNWSTLYMNSNSIAESIANRFKIKKSDILDPESDNMSARLALAETHIIQETKAFLSENGMCLDSFGKKEKSDTVILVKNITFSTTKEDLQQLFGWYGEIGRILIPPAQTLAVIEFLHPTEARNAFTNLAYKMFKGVPLYLEKAPSGVFKNDESSEQEGKKVVSSADLVEPTPDIDDDNVDVDSEVTATLFVKNISFETTEEGLKNLFKSTPGMKSAKIRMKNDQKNPGKKLSMGFGFIEYDSIKNAKNALKAMQNYLLDGHALQLKFSNRGDVIQRKKKDEIIKKKQESTKVIVKNVAFETTIKELRELFGAYGQIKSLRIPKKFDRTSRGFAFIEFLTKRDARNVMENLRDTHLLGRHLILEYAETEKNVEELREKAGREYIADIEGGDGRMRKRKKVDMEDWKESQHDDEMEE